VNYDSTPPTGRIALIIFSLRKLFIQLEKPGPVVDPPLKLKVEVGENPDDKDALKKILETTIRE
jgi:hypothetical protein